MTATTTGPTITAEDIASYQRNGFLKVEQVISPERVARYREAAAQAYEHAQSLDPANEMFRQIVNIWQRDPVLRELALDQGIAGLATQLAGVPLRLWHDHLLIKKPHNHTPTEFHQDAPYWPHAGARHQLSCWVALVDVPVERGCMSFIPGSHRRHDLRAIDLTDGRDLFSVAPDLEYQQRVTVPLKAGDCTFHNGYLAHTANANDTDEFRYAMVSIYVDREVTFDGKAHVCTNDLGLAIGDHLPDDKFPPVP